MLLDFFSRRISIKGLTGTAIVYMRKYSLDTTLTKYILNIFAYFWPEIIKEHRVARVDTPILIARRGKNEIKFYHNEEYDDWLKTNDATKWDIEYYKGLSALNDAEYKDLIQNPNIYYYEMDNMAEDELEIWFGGNADKRKMKLT